MRSWILACFILMTTALWCQQDSINRPALIIKASIIPLEILFAESNHVGFGYEFRLRRNWTLSGNTGITFRSPFYNSGTDPAGYSIGQEIRRYNKASNFFWGLNVMRYLHTFSEFGFIDLEGGYSKALRVEQKSWGTHFICGIQAMSKTSRFCMDLYLGLGVSYDETRYTNLTPSETANIVNQPYSLKDPNQGLTEIGYRTRPAIFFGFHFGYVLIP